MNKKRIAIIVSSFILVIMIIIVTCLLTQCGGGNDVESSKTDTESSATVQESSKTNTKDESSKTNAKDESSKASSSESSKTTSTESSKTTTTESSKTNSESSKPTQGDNAGNTGNTGSTDSKPASGGSTGGGSTGGSTTQGCSHNWQPVYTTVHHDAVTHTEQVQTGTKTVEINPAWDENVEVGETYYIRFSNGVEWDVPVEGADEDFLTDVMHCCNTNGVSYSVETRYIYEVVHHEAITREEPVYETKTVTDQAAYDEQVITGYKCSKCGASK